MYGQSLQDGGLQKVISAQDKMTLEFVRDRIINDGTRRNERGETSGAILAIEKDQKSQNGTNRDRSKSLARGEAEYWNCRKNDNLRGDESNSMKAIIN